MAPPSGQFQPPVSPLYLVPSGLNATTITLPYIAATASSQGLCPHPWRWVPNTDTRVILWKCKSGKLTPLLSLTALPWSKRPRGPGGSGLITSPSPLSSLLCPRCSSRTGHLQLSEHSRQGLTSTSLYSLSFYLDAIFSQRSAGLTLSLPVQWGLSPTTMLRMQPDPSSLLPEHLRHPYDGGTSWPPLTAYLLWLPRSSKSEYDRLQFLIIKGCFACLGH